jgi:hypothetical protein
MRAPSANAGVYRAVNGKMISKIGPAEAIPTPGYAQKWIVGNLLRFILPFAIDFAGH